MLTTDERIEKIESGIKELLSCEYGCCHLREQKYSSGEESYHLYDITGLKGDGVLTIARDWCNRKYMAAFNIGDEIADIYFGFNTKDGDTIRWRIPDGHEGYYQGNMKTRLLIDDTSDTMKAIIDGTGIRDDGHEGHYFHTLHRSPQSIYGESAEDAITEIYNAYNNNFSKDIVKAAIMYHTLLVGDYDAAAFWCGIELPVPEENDEGYKDYSTTEKYINQLSAKDLIDIFENMDSRFNTWATPSYDSLTRMRELMRPKYTKYLAVFKHPETDLGINDSLTMSEYSFLIGHVKEEWAEMTLSVDDMRSYLNGEYNIKWEPNCEIGDPNEPELMDAAFLPIYSEELTPSENFDMIKWANAKSYIAGTQFLDYHEGYLIDILGEELFNKLYEEIEAEEN